MLNFQGQRCGASRSVTLSKVQMGLSSSLEDQCLNAENGRCCLTGYKHFEEKKRKKISVEAFIVPLALVLHITVDPYKPTSD